MSVVLYDQKRFGDICATLQSAGADYASCLGYPEGWKKSAALDGYYRQFAQDLRRANTLAWNQQYDDNEPLDVSVDNGTVLGNVAFYKACTAVRYNLVTNAGEIRSLNNCKAVLVRIISAVANEIISHLPEYDKAEW